MVNPSWRVYLAARMNLDDARELIERHEVCGGSPVGIVDDYCNGAPLDVARAEGHEAEVNARIVVDGQNAVEGLLDDDGCYLYSPHSSARP